MPNKTSTPLFTLLLCLFLQAGLSLSLYGKKDAWLRKVTPLVKPCPYAKSSLGKVQGQMIQLITVLGHADRTDGPNPNELVTRACEAHQDYGPIRTMVTASIVERAYKDAVYLGLFNKKGQFTSVIQNGPDVGEKIRFEYIVSPKTAPEFSQDIANIRIVLSKQKRAEESLGHREKIHHEKLKKMKRETRSRKDLRERESNHFLDTTISGPDLGPHYERWEAAMEVAGEAANLPAQIKIEARKNSSASVNNGQKMSVRIKVNNYINVPTKVTVHCYMLGRTDVKRVLFKIGHAKKEVVLLPKDEQQMILSSASFPTIKSRAGALDGLPSNKRANGKFSAQGWVVRVEHNGEAVAACASITKLIPLADEKFRELNGLP